MRKLVVLAAALLIGACSGTEQSAPRSVERRWLGYAADTLWVRGGIEDTLIQLPLAIAADHERVYVADLGSNRVVALDAANGEPAWVAGRQGSGPEEFLRPAALALLPGSRLAVSDTRNGRIAVMSTAGEFLETFRVDDPEINGMCGMADTTLITVASREGPMIARYSLDGVELSRLDLPWDDLEKVSSLARQATASVGPDGHECVIALTLGRGFAILRDSSFRDVHDYVEAVPVPHVEVTVTGNADNQNVRQRLVDAIRAARAVVLTQDRFYVAFYGATADAGRILDEYERDGAYRHSHRLPATPSEMIGLDGTFYIITNLEGVPTLTALRLREGT